MGWDGMDTPGGVEPRASRVAACPVLGTVRLRRGMAPPAEFAPASADRQSAVLLLDHGGVAALPRAAADRARPPSDGMVAGVGIAPTCMAYEARLDLSPANPRCGRGPPPLARCVGPALRRRGIEDGCWSGMPTVWIRSVTREPVPRSRSALGTTRLETVLVRTRCVPAAANGGHDRDRTDGRPVANRMLFR
jgi:hypothetical protein